MIPKVLEVDLRHIEYNFVEFRKKVNSSENELASLMKLLAHGLISNNSLFKQLSKSIGATR